MTLVFIEGASGVGKSRSAAKLRDRLVDDGYAVACYLEGDIKSPLDLFWNACFFNSIHEYLDILDEFSEFADCIAANTIFGDGYTLVRYQDEAGLYFPRRLYKALKAREVCYMPQSAVPYNVFLDIFLDRWGAFFGKARPEFDFIIFDGVMHRQINDMLRNYTATDDEVMRHVTSLFGLAENHEATMFYLEACDVRKRLYDARMCRGQTVPTEEMFAFWENRKRVDLLALDGLSIRQHKIDITGESWKEYNETIYKITTGLATI